MSWERPGGPPEITFEIPLRGGADEAPGREPVPRHRGRAAGVLGGVAAMALVAAAVVAASGEPEAAAPTTTMPSPSPTLPPVAPLPDERLALAGRPAAFPSPTFPPSVAMPADMLDEFDLHTALAVTTADRVTRSVTVVESEHRTLEHRASYDPVSRRDERVLRDATDGRVAFTMILDRDSGQRYRRFATELWWRRSGPHSPRDGWTPEVLDSLRLGPVHSGTIGWATAIKSGPVTAVADADGRPGPPVRVFHVSIPAQRLADTSLAELGLLDPAPADRSDVTFVVYASPVHGVVLVTAEILTGSYVTTVRHFIDVPEEPPRIALPDTADVIERPTA